MIGCMRQLINSEHETELESLSKLIPTIGRELENEQRGQEVNIKWVIIRMGLTVTHFRSLRKKILYDRYTYPSRQPFY